jgi:DNA (cytosine-5)-methyltransferase 1
MSLGFEEAGYVPSLAVDLDLDAILTYRANRPWTTEQSARCANIVDLLNNGEFAKMAGQVEGVIGGPPCQTFSLVGFRTKKLHDRDGKITADTRTWLPVKMAEVISAVKPKFCVMENVAGFMSALNGSIRKATLKVIKEAGYAVVEAKVRAEKHGAPQLRWRYMLIGIRNDAVGGRRRAEELVQEIGEILDAGTQNPTSLDEALRVLEGFGDVGAGAGAEFLSANGHQTWNHYARSHNRRDLAIYASLQPGETAEALEARTPGVIPYSLESFHDKYRKLDGSRPSPTIPAHLKRDANSFILDGVNRGLTPREAATIQGFPTDYLFVGEQSHQFQQVGNAVPPPVAKTVASLVRKALAKGMDPKWQPSIVRGHGKAPAKETIVVRRRMMELSASGEIPKFPIFLHWCARRLQRSKDSIRPMVYREYRDRRNREVTKHA